MLTVAVLTVTMIGAVMDRFTARMTVRRTQKLWEGHPVPEEGEKQELAALLYARIELGSWQSVD
jgi:hypothetical protein